MPYLYIKNFLDWNLDFGNCLEFGHWLLDLGYWLLEFG
jgi:hypothetical protein